MVKQGDDKACGYHRFVKAHVLSFQIESRPARLIDNKVIKDDRFRAARYYKMVCFTK